MKLLKHMEGKPYLLWHLLCSENIKHGIWNMKTIINTKHKFPSKIDQDRKNAEHKASG